MGEWRLGKLVGFEGVLCVCVYVNVGCEGVLCVCVNGGCVGVLCVCV